MNVSFCFVLLNISLSFIKTVNTNIYKLINNNKIYDESHFTLNSKLFFKITLLTVNKIDKTSHRGLRFAVLFVTKPPSS